MKREWTKFFRPRRAAAPPEPPAHVVELTDESEWWKFLYRQEAIVRLTRDDVTYLGWTSPEEAQTLENYAECVPQGGQVVEIGSFLGKSTRWLLLGCFLGGSQLDCIDPWNGIEEDKTHSWDHLLMGDSFSAFRIGVHQAMPFGEQTEGRFACHRGYSQRMVKHWRKPIDLLFIDGDHTRALTDFEQWERHLKPHALVIFDDVGATAEKYGPLGPAGAVQTILRREGEKWNVGTIGKYAILTRDPEFWRTRIEAHQDRHERTVKWASYAAARDRRRADRSGRDEGTAGSALGADSEG